MRHYACAILVAFSWERAHESRTSLGRHDAKTLVKLIAPEAVRPFVKKGKKNDAANAAALCAAASRPDVKFVPAKSL